jgi:hypothetical protein
MSFNTSASLQWQQLQSSFQLPISLNY